MASAIGDVGVMARTGPGQRNAGWEAVSLMVGGIDEIDQSRVVALAASKSVAWWFVGRRRRSTLPLVEWGMVWGVGD
jgi:hypothetical protein